MTSSLGVVMVAHGCNDEVARTLETLGDIGRRLDHVISVVVVDNASPTPIRHAGDSQHSLLVDVVRNDANVGFAAAANQGGRLLTTDALWFLNPDTRPSAEATSALLAALERRGPSVLGPRLVDEAGTEMRSGGAFHDSLRRVLERWLPRRCADGASAEQQVDWVPGTALLLPRRTWLEVDGFSEEYYMYFEDVDLCRRLAERAVPSYVVPAATVVHRGGGAYERYPSSRRQADYRMSRLRFFQKHAPLRGALIAPLLDLPGWGRYNRPL